MLHGNNTNVSGVQTPVAVNDCSSFHRVIVGLQTTESRNVQPFSFSCCAELIWNTCMQLAASVRLRPWTAPRIRCLGPIAGTGDINLTLWHNVRLKSMSIWTANVVVLYANTTKWINATPVWNEPVGPNPRYADRCCIREQIQFEEIRVDTIR